MDAPPVSSLPALNSSVHYHVEDQSVALNIYDAGNGRLLLDFQIALTPAEAIELHRQLGREIEDMPEEVKPEPQSIVGMFGIYSDGSVRP